MFSSGNKLCSLFFAVAASAVLFSAAPGAAENVFVHSTFEDFSAGELGNSGQNLFASRCGQLRFVNWFDFDNDGHPEIFVGNDHNYYDTSDAFIYYNRPGRGFTSLRPPVSIREDVPGFLQMQWVLDSLENIGRIPALGGGKPIAVDLNLNGYPDIVFTNWVHGWYRADYPAFIYWGSSEGYSMRRMSVVPTMGGNAVAAADLNGSGRKDLIIANGGREDVIRRAGAMSAEERRAEGVAYPESRSYIYLNTVYGFTEDDRIELPTEYAIDVKAADLTGNGHYDLVFLQAGREGGIRIFEGGPEGIDPERYTDIMAIDPAWEFWLRSLLVADLNGDGRPDIFVPSRGRYSQIFWNSPEGFSEENHVKIETRDAMAAAAADLDGSGFADLVIANDRGNYSYLYWGGEGGFSPENRTELPTLSATDVAAADINGSDVIDIVFSNRRDAAGGTVDVPSYIYWGAPGGRYDVSLRDELSGFGSAGVAVEDFDGSGLKDIFIMNRWSGRSGRVDAYVYWGNENARYSPSKMTRLPGLGEALNAAASDLTGNGHADLIYVGVARDSVNIFRGNAGGFDKDPDVLELPFRGGNPAVADLNGDGLLDIIVTSASSDEIAVFPGSEDGFDEPVVIETGIRSGGGVLGDVNGSGRLDLVLRGAGEIKVLFGLEEGFFNADESLTLETGMSTASISLADFNDNGRLDILGHNSRPVGGGREATYAYSAIYWNRNGAFNAEDRTDLKTHLAIHGSVADVNLDGYPDILFSNYHGAISRHIPVYVHLGDGRESYQEENRLELPAYSSPANLALDLNASGYMDIIVFNHSRSSEFAGLGTRGADHAVGSFIYWGGADGWSVENRSMIPSFGPHSRLTPDPGSIVNRGSYETYVSAPVHFGRGKRTARLLVEADANFRQDIRAFIRVAGDEGFSGKEWWQMERVEVEGVPFAFEGYAGSGEELHIQYKLHLDSGHSGTGPVVNEVRLARR